MHSKNVGKSDKSAGKILKLVDDDFEPVRPTMEHNANQQNNAQHTKRG